VRTLKVTTSISITDVELSIIDTEHTEDLSDARKYSLESGKKLKEIVKANSNQHLHLLFRVKNAASRTTQVHQAFLKFTNDKSGKEQNFAAITTEKQYRIHIPLSSLHHNPPHPPAISGNLELIIGDSFITNSNTWVLGSLSVNVPAENETTEDPLLKPLKEIKHEFRLPDRLAGDMLSYSFTLAVVAPIGILIIGLLLHGANLKRFPGGIDALSAIGFIGCIGGILAIYTCYFLHLNAFQTLGYLLLIALPTLFTGHRVLSHLSRH